MARLSTDYLRLLQSLLPRGGFWTRAVGSVLSEYLHAEADELTRIDNRAQDLLKERNTLYTNELISDHELELGLPDECTRDLTLSLAERRIEANVKLTATGQQDPNYFVEIANKYGYEAEATEYYPFWCGVSACGDSIGPLSNLFYWKLTIFTEEEPILFICGEGACGDPLQKISELLQTVFCYAEKWKPAHTVLQIEIAGPGFDTGFGSGFDSLPSQSADYLSGGFSLGFSFGFNVNLGAGFDVGFTNGFERIPT